MASVTVSEVERKLRSLSAGDLALVYDLVSRLHDSAPPHSDGETGVAEGHAAPLSARVLVESNLVGLWADRDDLADSPAVARQLREQAQRRGRP